MTYASYYNEHLTRDVGREAMSAFSPLFPFPAGTAQERMPDKEFTGYNLIAPLWTIQRYQTVKPIKVHIYVEDNIFFAENETLIIVGTGKSIGEAIADLSNHIIHFYHYYQRLPDDKVTGDAIRLKKMYKTLFVEGE